MMLRDIYGNRSIGSEWDKTIRRQPLVYDDHGYMPESHEFKAGRDLTEPSECMDIESALLFAVYCVLSNAGLFPLPGQKEPSHRLTGNSIMLLHS